MIEYAVHCAACSSIQNVIELSVEMVVSSAHCTLDLNLLNFIR